MTFTQFPLHDRLQRAIVTAGYQTPTPIQSAAIPIVLAGGDIVGTAKTGTGKTAAFVLPILHRLLTIPGPARKTRALILVPTRELAEQVHATISLFGRHTNIRSATVYGGVGMAVQERALRNGTEIIIACPGRLLDHVARGNTDLSLVECLVLDEADRMLDMGFLPPITRIVGLLPVERQTLLFSATFDPALKGFVNAHLRGPQRLAVDNEAPPAAIEHALYPVAPQQKMDLLTMLLRKQETDAVLIFTRTKQGADVVVKQLIASGFNADVLHSNKTQVERQLVMGRFRKGEIQVLVATDIAARGIDVTGISHVINFDIPETADDYIHRVGRTGRAECSGIALTLATPGDARLVRDIEQKLDAALPTRYLDGFSYQQAPSTPAKQKHRKPSPTQPAGPAGVPPAPSALRSTRKSSSTQPAGPAGIPPTPSAPRSPRKPSTVRPAGPAGVQRNPRNASPAPKQQKGAPRGKARRS